MIKNQSIPRDAIRDKDPIIVNDEMSISTTQFVIFTLFSVVLAYLSRESAIISTIYALVVFLAGLSFIASDHTPIRIIYLSGYIVGAELIWRSTNAGIYYEFGKYAIIALLILSIIKYRLLPKAEKWPLVYFIVLLPSIVLLQNMDREAISFALSGPFLLAIAALFFSTVKLSTGDVKKLLIAIILPTLGISFLAGFSTITAENLRFTSESNYITAGGFGPVQISSQLGLGAMMAFYYALTERRNRSMTLVMSAISILLLSQSVLTFSRGGLYNFIGAILVAAIFFFRNSQSRTKLFALVVFTGLLMLQFVIPYLNDYTEGKLETRFQDTSVTDRDVLMRADWLAFTENPLMGVGPGQAIKYHALFGMLTSSHTEYTRLLAEHGLLGAISLLIIIFYSLRPLFSRLPAEVKGLKMLLIIWALLYMLYATMRTASPGFIFALSLATFEFPNTNQNDNGYSLNR